MEIINKVESSGLITFDLEEFYIPGNRMLLDISDQLFEGFVLREKDFRSYIKNQNWSVYQDCFVAITCSTDAIVPTWAFMLLTSALSPFAKKVVFGNLEQLETLLYKETLLSLDIEKYREAKIVIKGCGKLPVPKSAFVEAMFLLRPLAKSIMYGEPCSTVPLYKAVESKSE